MNLYKVNLHADPITGIYGESFHVQAGSAKQALEKAYRKFDKRYPHENCEMVIHSLTLVEEKW